jgi:methyl-accepting chemotaxis protein
MSSERLFKNVSFFWKISGAFLVSLLIAFFVMRTFLCATFFEVEKDLVQNVILETQSEADIALSIARTALDRRMRDVSGASLESAFELDVLLNSNSLSSSDKLRDYIIDTSGSCSFFLLLNSAGEVVRGTKSMDDSVSSGADSFQKALLNSHPVSLVDWDLLAAAENKKSVSAVSVIPGKIIAMLNLWPSKDTDEGSGQFDDEALAVVSINRIGSKGKPYFLVGGYLLNYEEHILPEAVEVSSRYGNDEDGKKALVKPVFSLFQGTTRVASTVVGKNGKNATGTSMTLPGWSVGKGADQIWRQQTEVKGTTFVAAYCPILSIGGSTIGYIGAGIDVESLMAARKKMLDLFRSRTGRDLAIALIISLVFALAAGVAYARMLSKPLIALAGLTNEIARGNLNIVVPYDGNDEIGVFAEGFRDMIANLSSLVSSIEMATIELHQSSEELNANISMQTATTSQQSAAVNETTATLEELAASSRQIADSSLAVVRLASKTLESAKEGVSASRETTSLMGTIRQAGIDDIMKIATLSSRVARIDEIMRLINNIADQTKLIAFNAAIEAAAAGEAGHRFNVVSEEIRRLADNVQDKGREIRVSIGDVQESARALDESCREDSDVIESGVVVTEKTSNELEEILRDSEGVLTDSKKISMATQEQRLATEQTLSAVREINKAVTELAAGMKTSENVASRLSGLANKLSGAVSRFELDTLNRNTEGETVDGSTVGVVARLTSGVK